LKIKDRTSRFKLYAPKTQQKFTVLCVEVYGEQTVYRCTVSRWATRIREGRVTINDDQRLGSPKTSTDERSVKFVADFLAQDRRATCEEISQAAWI